MNQLRSLNEKHKLLACPNGWARQDVADLTPLRFGRPKTEETVKTPLPSSPCPQANSIILGGSISEIGIFQQLVHQGIDIVPFSVPSFRLQSALAGQKPV